MQTQRDGMSCGLQHAPWPAPRPTTAPVPHHPPAAAARPPAPAHVSRTRVTNDTDNCGAGAHTYTQQWKCLLTGNGCGTEACRAVVRSCAPSRLPAEGGSYLGLRRGRRSQCIGLLLVEPLRHVLQRHHVWDTETAATTPASAPVRSPASRCVLAHDSSRHHALTSCLGAKLKAPFMHVRLYSGGIKPGAVSPQP